MVVSPNLTLRAITNATDSSNTDAFEDVGNRQTSIANAVRTFFITDLF